MGLYNNNHKPQRPAHHFLHYKVAMNALAEIAGGDHPAYVRVQALKTIVRETSPGNPSQRENHLALGLQPHPAPQPKPSPQPRSEPRLPEGPLTPEQQREFHIHPVWAEVEDLIRGESVTQSDPEPESEEEDEPP